MTERDWRIMKEDFDIRIRGGSAPLPLRAWHEAPLGEGILRAITEAKYVQPSPIQRQAIPVGLELRDLIGATRRRLVFGARRLSRPAPILLKVG